jgi:hypothetical protein
MLDSKTSYNFKIAKVLAILLVALGHIGVGCNIWIPVTVGLFIFGFSSAFFTAAKYDDSFQCGTFWHKKLTRLGPHLLVINSFLLILFLIEGKPGIVTWQTPCNMLGLTGILNWFSLSNPSPFGQGLWFFTLLLIFYALYPWLRKTSRSRWALSVLLGVSLGVFGWMDRVYPMGHSLWLTAWSFLFGIFVYRFNLALSVKASGLLAIGLTALLVFLNAKYHFNQGNFFLIVGISVAVVLGLRTVNLPQNACKPLAFLSGSVLEIYFIHSYLIFDGIKPIPVKVAASLACIIGTAWILSTVAKNLDSWLSKCHFGIQTETNIAMPSTPSENKLDAGH